MEMEILEKNFLAYNASVQNVLSDKNWLSYLLQKFANNFKNLDRNLIESLIGDVSKNNEVYKIYGISNEDNSFLDGTVKFDLLFTTRLPESNDKIGMLINLELQSAGSDTDLKRMIYYCNRMLVSEKGRIFAKDEYKDIVKVGAIWICVKNKKELENTVNVYSIQETNIKENYKADVESYDLMEIVALYLGNDLSIEDLAPINILFKSNLKPEEIFELLENKYDIHLHMDTKKEVSSMCDLGQGIYKDGIICGLQQGIQEGKINATVNYITNLMDSLKIDFNQAVFVLKLSDEMIAICKEKMNLN